MRKILQVTRLGRMQQIYGLLILLIIVNGFLLYVKIFVTQSFSWLDLAINIGGLLSIGIGYFFGAAAAAIFGFVYVVWYTVWLTTYAPNPIWIDYVRIVLIPTICGIASYVKRLQRDIMVSYRKLKKAGAITLVDERTGVANIQAFVEALEAQEAIKKSYSRYRYLVTVLRIEFIDFIKDELGVEAFYELIDYLHDKYNEVLHAGEHIYWNGRDAFLFLLPYGTEDRGKSLRRLLTEASLSSPEFQRLSAQVKFGMIDNIQLEQIMQSKGIEGALYKLRQLTEEDIDGEYIR